MRGKVDKSRARHSRLKLSKASQGKLLGVVANKSAELPSSHRGRSLVDGDLAQGTTPLQSRKRQLDALSASDLLLAKRARLTQTDGQTDTGSLRSSARLRALQHPASSRDPTRPVPPAPPCELQTETNAGSFPLSSKQARLTRKNLRRLNRMTKSKSVSGKELPSVSSKTKTTTEGSKSTAKTISTTSSGFEAQALKNGVLDRLKSKAPTNLSDQRARLNRDRETVSPSESMYEDYVAGVTTAPNKQTIIREMSKLLKEHNDRGYRKVNNQAFTGFPKEVGFNNGLSAPQPDFVEGLQLQKFLPFPADEQLDGAILIKDNPYSITLPHLAGEWKGPRKDINEARMQSAYDGAALVYGRDQALEFLGDPDPPGYAAVRSFTTDGTNINFFSHYSALSEEPKTLYHQYPTTSTNLTNSFEEFKKGRKQLRNLQEDARDQSYALRDRLRDHWRAKQGAAPSVGSVAIGGSLNDIQEEPWSIPAQESNLYPNNVDGYTRPSRPTKPTRHKHTTLSRASAGFEGGQGYEELDAVGNHGHVDELSTAPMNEPPSDLREAERWGQIRTTR